MPLGWKSGFSST
uniref:Uncharacterized protein n=1 Tax=Anguilla anguilla TaxID=7936 RepID=A0A0E9S046_ANGAN